MIDKAALDTILLKARSYSYWQEKPVSDEILRQIHDIMRMGPTSANMCPLRIVFVKSEEAKERLKPLLDKGNVEKTMSAPVTAIFGHDLEYYEKLPKLFPHTDAKSWFKDLPPEAQKVIALRNGSLQAAYFMIAARAAGLDCGPMSGFNNEKVDAEFFAGTNVKSNFICALGYGVKEKLHPRSPRLEFDETSRII